MIEWIPFPEEGKEDVKTCCWCGRRPSLTVYKNRKGSYRYKAGCRFCRDFTKYFDKKEDAVKSWNNEESILSAKGPALSLN